MTGATLLLALLLAGKQRQEDITNNTCTQAITYLEARGESVKGIAAVRQVIANRSRESGRGACRVVARKAQFSSYRRGMKLSNVELDGNFLRKWEASSRMPPVLGKDYTFFYKKGKKPKWSRGMDCGVVIRHHVFCRD